MELTLQRIETFATPWKTSPFALLDFYLRVRAINCVSFLSHLSFSYHRSFPKGHLFALSSSSQNPKGPNTRTIYMPTGSPGLSGRASGMQPEHSTPKKASTTKTTEVCPLLFFLLSVHPRSLQPPAREGNLAFSCLLRGYLNVAIATATPTTQE